MKNTVIKASAGSGKTFKLSNEYIDLICGSTAVDEILASTFTVKAAGEIGDRILSRLAKAAVLKKEDNNFDKYGLPELQKHAASSKKLTQAELQKRVAGIAKELYKMRVSTLDSFFQKIAGAFSIELDFPSGWTMSDETLRKKLIALAVTRVLRKNKTVESENKTAKELLYQFQKGEAKRSVSRELIDIAENYIDLFRQTKEEDWTQKHQSLFETEPNAAQIAAAADYLNNLEKEFLPKAVKKDDSLCGNWKKQCDGLYRQIRDTVNAASQSSLDSIFALPLIQNILSKKNTYWSIDLTADPELLRNLEPLAEQSKIQSINKLVGTTKSAYHLLKLIAEEYDSIVKQIGCYYFNDVTENLRKGFGNVPSEALNHRLNAAANYLMLDEFQDTSIPQWDVLKPFVSAAKNDGSVFVVGDKKQAIYGWRGGVAEIFDKAQKMLDIDNKDVEYSTISWRSSPVILDAVNHIFSNLNSNAALVAQPKVSKNKKGIENVKTSEPLKNEEECKQAITGFDYKEHEPCGKNKELPGFVSLVVSDKEDKKEDNTSDNASETDGSNADDGSSDSVYTDYDNDITPYIKDAAEKILGYVWNKETGEPKNKDAQIGVLTRRGEKAKNILICLRQLVREYELDKKFGIDVSGEGGVLLADSNAVQYILSLMKLADHPNDTAALFHLAHCEPLLQVLELKPYGNDEYAAAAYSASSKIRKSLLNDGYGKTVKKYADALFPLCDKREEERLKKLIELSFLFDDTVSGVRTADYIKKFSEEEVKIFSLAANINVMTIHKSKGLEFDIVVLPDLEFNLVGRTPQFLTARKNNEPANDVDWVLKYAGKELQAFLPEDYQKAFQARIRNEVQESLCLLYVAMTRAKQELLLLLPYKNRNKYNTSFAGVLLAGFEIPVKDKESLSGKQLLNITNQTLEPNEDWYNITQKPEQKEDSEALEENKVLTIIKPITKSARNLQRLSPSTIDFNDEIRIKHKSAPKDDEDIIEMQNEKQTAPLTKTKNGQNPLVFGTSVHSCFEILQWIDEMPGDAELTDAIRRSTQYAGEPIDEQYIENVKTEFHACCKKPKIKELLAEQKDKNADVETERRFVLKTKQDGKDVILRGSIDRLVIYKDGSGAVTDLKIFDYKTDKEIPEDNHAPQMNAYKKAMAKMYGLPEDKIAAQVVYVRLGELR